MSLLALQNVTKAYDFKPVLTGVNLTINEGERIGLLGPNGTGKTTLLRILAGLEVPDEGERAAKKNLKLGYLEQDPLLDGTLTVRDAVRSGLEGRAAVLAEIDLLHRELERPHLPASRLDTLLTKQARLEQELDALGGHDVEHQVETLLRHLGLREADVLCGNLSGGERRRVALARLLIARPDLLLLDEPTNHLDAIVSDWLEDWLIEAHTPLLLVTHDRYFLDRVVDRIVELEQGRLVDYDGGYSWYLWSRTERKDAATKAESNRRNLLRRETEWARRGPPARTTKSKARLERYEKLVTSGPAADLGTIELQLPPGPRLGEKVLRLKGVSKQMGGRMLFSGLDLELQGGMRLGIVGPNGAGKSTFLKLCLGQIAPDAGEVVIGETVKFASIDQQRTDLDLERTVVQEVAADEAERVKVGERLVRIETFLDRFLFPGARKQAPIKTLSGGERNRVLLAKLLLRGGNVVALDEPTNDLDLETLRVLEEALCAFPGVILVVSHDRWFLDRVATRILHLDGEGSWRLHEGDLSTLLQRIARERVAADAAETKEAGRKAKAARSSPSPASPGPKLEPAIPKRKLSFAERKEHEGLPAKIAKAEAQAAELDRRFADASLYTRPRTEVETLQAERTRLAAEIARLYARWEELEALAAM